MSPHTLDRTTRLACEEYLALPTRGGARSASGRLLLDQAHGGQHHLHALLAANLMSPNLSWEPEARRRNAVTQRRTARYVQWIADRGTLLEIKTTIAARVAACILPTVNRHGAINGMPGLRLAGITARRIHLTHLPTGGRIDLIDDVMTHASEHQQVFKKEVVVGNRRERPVFEQDTLDPAELTHPQLTEPAHCPQLLAGLLVRAVALWWHLGIDAAWLPPSPQHSTPCLTWLARSGADVDEVGDLLTRSPIAVPDLAYASAGRHGGLLTLGSERVRLQLAELPV
ncbi:hypothetical protein CG723_45300 [Streptomyces sp. CB01635]|uniref:hypothetical protein n=1 Tax=unclassified Streptomyces TaxID=2593676 RepID=UPI000C27E95D|nr:hypothetical protein [Streptomyces sp. CB01635]PJN05353.1 hypothetical protein CG723_45300 [Streptomyces sp. CB01635]